MDDRYVHILASYANHRRVDEQYYDDEDKGADEGYRHGNEVENVFPYVVVRYHDTGTDGDHPSMVGLPFGDIQILMEDLLKKIR
jgi:hypothetical protein